ncbi:unnamed protein product [Heligmosomoides polygyrus]|uniref:Peptidase M12A domain-containing protein n=1 Tax=Heligmosomoides polygyrus TaxID=6339 RepID=A0A183GME6_HELPZ|nr:unnamed protein product [Heligmosomoides polygyrus]
MGFDEDDEETHDIAVIKQQFMHEPIPSTFAFPQPPLGIQAKDFVATHFGYHNLAFTYEPATSNYKVGIVVAVYSRASSGEYISSEITWRPLWLETLLTATFGPERDCNLFKLREKTRIAVSAASKYFANVLYGKSLSVGSMIAGYDKRGPQIFKVECDAPNVQRCSGSLNAYGILDTHYKRKMTDEEALKLGRRVIMHATYRNSGSGGVCHFVHITPMEKIRLPPIDVIKLWYELADERRDIAYEPRRRRHGYVRGCLSDIHGYNHSLIRALADHTGCLGKSTTE